MDAVQVYKHCGPRVKLSYRYTTRVKFSPSVGRHTIMLRCLPSREAFQHVCEESFSVSDDFWHRESIDGFGNRVVSGGTRERHSLLEYTSCGVVESSTYCIPDASPHPMYLLPSRMTEVSREILLLLPRKMSGVVLEDAMRIMHAAHGHLAYTPGVTTMETTAMDVCRRRQGVCQDYAHLMIVLCRIAGMPARYVCGMMEGEGSTHAWVEVHDGQCWYAFDPTNDTAVASGYIKLAHGRDVCDCPVSRGSFIGRTQEVTEISVVTERLEE